MDNPQSAIRNPQSTATAPTQTLCDSHCHFFSSRFLELLTKDRTDFPADDRAKAVAQRLGWDDPGSTEALADRWRTELARHEVSRCALIASIPGDEPSVATAVATYPREFVGFFMFNPLAPDADERLTRALGPQRLRGIALFPAMHRYRLEDPAVDRVFERAAASGAAVFVHCGVLSVGVRKKLGLASPFDLRLGDPLGVAQLATRYPAVPVIIPHFGAGLLREALMAAEQSPNIHLDTSSSNGWMKYYPGLTLEVVFRQALGICGANRLLFGTDSSFFPRGWQKPIYDAQVEAIDAAGASAEDRAKILGGNFDRLFPA
jgi:predicted TIM-barrel fold metal-dependent hydrolase